MSKRSRQRHRGELHAQQARENQNEHEHKIPEPAPLSPPPPDGPVIEVERATAHAVGEFVEQAVERARADTSQQPRFQPRDPNEVSSLFWSTFRWVKWLEGKEPSANSTPATWDEFLREFVQYEPYLVGVLNSTVQIDKNRHWSLTGGRNQVMRFTDILKGADEGAGWRAYVAWQAQSYYFARAGFVTETGRDGESGPLRALWSVDPVRVDLTGNPAAPLKYRPLNGSAQTWLPEDFFRAASLPSTDEARRGYGFPALARCYEGAKIMVGVYQVFQEATFTTKPQGVILGKGISEETWKIALQSYDESLVQYNQRFGKLMTLMNEGSDAPEISLQMFRRLPDNFDLQKWTSLLMYLYALAFGYDAREYFPVDSGDLGSAKETETQHRKASSKGDLDFSLAHQEQIQNQLPASLLFEYEQRDVQGEVADAEAAKVKAELVTELTRWEINGASVLTSEQILQIAAQHGIIPDEWTPQEEEVSASDVKSSEMERTRENGVIRRAAERFPQEPIVRYEFPGDRARTLFSSGEDLLRRRSFPAVAVPK